MIGLERERRGLWRLDQLQSQEIGRFSRVIHPPATSSEEGVRLACVRPAASVRSERVFDICSGYNFNQQNHVNVMLIIVSCIFAPIQRPVRIDENIF